jgi:UDP-glucose 4-epimerase
MDHHRRHKLSVILLRTSRFFPETDDDIRGKFTQDNVQANELLNRRVDIADVVSAHLLAAEKAKAIGFRRFIISATTPFEQADLAALRLDAAAVVERLFPDCASLYAERNWRLFPELDRVYVNRLATSELGWRPEYDFCHVLDCLRTDRDFRSQLAVDIGVRGYRDEVLEEGTYPKA